MAKTPSNVLALRRASRAALEAANRLEEMVTGLVEADQPDLRSLQAAGMIQETAQEIRRHALWLHAESDLLNKPSAEDENG